MRIKVISIKGMAPPQAIGHEFGQGGGTIGREAGNQLILPDPDKHISRMQAQLLWENGSMVMIDHGGNPTSVNGRPLGRGNRVVLRDGDELVMGSYVLRAEAVAAPPSFAGASAPAAPTSDPLGLFGAASSSNTAAAPAQDPFGGLFAPAPPPPPQAPVIRPGAPMDASDDPFAVFAMPTPSARAPERVEAPSADPFAPPPPPAAPRASNPLGLDDLPTADPSVDSLFGLGPTASSSSDPLSGSPLAAIDAGPASTNNATDPLALFGGAPAEPVEAPRRDDAPLLNEAFVAPRIVAPPPVPAPAPAPAPVPAPAPASPGFVVSWDTGPAATPFARDVPATERTQMFARPAAEERVVPPPRPPAPPPPEAVPIPRSAEAPPATTPNVMPQNADALLEAFQRGLGIPLAPTGGMSPETMEHIGAMLREAVEGTMALLTARAVTKREVRAEVTMILSKDNNPLKFSPDLAFALTQLFAARGKGFMPPVEAMRDAYEDLRSHQFGFMAGMRAALTAVLARFSPDQLEAKISGRGLLDSVMPGNRKARLWDLYEQLYGEISREAEDDFHALFGREFLKAYEAQVERLRSDSGE
jgi:FHA domain-containing protein